ncbi:MAG: hypothetical protein HDR80_08660 [Bacteroides sp.]|nr:hypothetical protein [Bacteroides sp.]
MSTLPITRRLILLALILLAVVTAFCEPTPDNPRWYLSLLLSKAIAAVSLLLIRYLLRRWRRTPYGKSADS